MFKLNLNIPRARAAVFNDDTNDVLALSKVRIASVAHRPYAANLHRFNAEIWRRTGRSRTGIRFVHCGDDWQDCREQEQQDHCGHEADSVRFSITQIQHPQVYQIDRW